MKIYDYFVIFVIITKIIFVILALLLLSLKINHGEAPETPFMKNISFWKERVEFIFITNMSILLTYLFYPFREKPIAIDSHARTFLFVYGLLILLTAKLDLFIKESRWFYYIQRIFGGNYYQQYYSEEDEKSKEIK